MQTTKNTATNKPTKHIEVYDIDCKRAVESILTHIKFLEERKKKEGGILDKESLLVLSILKKHINY